MDPKLIDELHSISGRSVMHCDGVAEWEAETLQEIFDCLRSEEVQKASPFQYSPFAFRLIERAPCYAVPPT